MIRNMIYADEVEGSDGGYLITLECGHKLATRKKQISYECRQCTSENSEKVVKIPEKESEH